jgi:hypothetical protein
MSAVTQLKPTNSIIPTNVLKILKSNSWDNCSYQIKQYYSRIKLTLTEDKQNDLLIAIYNNTICGDGLCTYWRYMNN